MARGQPAVASRMAPLTILQILRRLRAQHDESVELANRPEHVLDHAEKGPMRKEGPRLVDDDDLLFADRPWILDALPDAPHQGRHERNGQQRIVFQPRQLEIDILSGRDRIRPRIEEAIAWRSRPKFHRRNKLYGPITR